MQIPTKNYKQAFKDAIAGQVTNMKEENYDFDMNVIETEDVIIGDGYIFEVFESYGQKEEIPEWNLVIITGHEETLIYNTNKKEYRIIQTR